MDTSLTSYCSSYCWINIFIVGICSPILFTLSYMRLHYNNNTSDETICKFTLKKPKIKGIVWFIPRQIMLSSILQCGRFLFFVKFNNYAWIIKEMLICLDVINMLTIIGVVSYYILRVTHSCCEDEKPKIARYFNRIAMVNFIFLAIYIISVTIYEIITLNATLAENLKKIMLGCDGFVLMGSFCYSVIEFILTTRSSPDNNIVNTRKKLIIQTVFSTFMFLVMIITELVALILFQVPKGVVWQNVSLWGTVICASFYILDCGFLVYVYKLNNGH